MKRRHPRNPLIQLDRAIEANREALTVLRRYARRAARDGAAEEAERLTSQARQVRWALNSLRDRMKKWTKE